MPPSSPFPILDIISDSDMEAARFAAAAADDDDAFKAFDRTVSSPSTFDNDLDAFLDFSAAATDLGSDSFGLSNGLHPKSFQNDASFLNQTLSAASFTESPEEPSSPSESPSPHPRTGSFESESGSKRNAGTAETTSLVDEMTWTPNYGIGAEDTSFFPTDPIPMDGGLPPDVDFLQEEDSVMSTHFDFESAASSPQPSANNVANGASAAKNSVDNTATRPLQPQNQQPATTVSGADFISIPVSDAPTPQSVFYFSPSSQPSPLNSTKGTSPAATWTTASPGAGLEDTFGGIDMSSTSPQGPTLMSGLSLAPEPFTFGARTTFPKPTAVAPVAAPEPIVETPRLTISQTCLKSRVETQIPIKLNMIGLPETVKKLRLPSHTISKPKFLAKAAEREKSADTYELFTSLVCTSAIQDKNRHQRAFARARGEKVAPIGKVKKEVSSDSESSKSGNEEEKPLEGGEVKICQNCVQRERKRAGRKKSRKPDEDEIFQKDEERRVIVFNTHEVKEWTNPQKDGLAARVGISTVPKGTMVVELPMRIACYCRHHNEKMGFQVIFTIKDHSDKVVAQAITNSIMITDDHKTHAPAPPPVTHQQMLDAVKVPGTGVFPTMMAYEAQPVFQSNRQPFRQSYSTTDLAAMQNNQRAPLPMVNATPFQAMAPAPAVAPAPVPQPIASRSRQPSPNGLRGPSNKRRKHSNGAKVPSGLAMTKLDTSQAMIDASSPRSASVRSITPNKSSFSGPISNPVSQPPLAIPRLSAGPPTPNSGDEYARGRTETAPSSAHPTRPPTPSINGIDISWLSPAASQSPSGVNGVPTPANNVPAPIVNRPIVSRIVPGEGTVNGGTEVSLLGHGYNNDCRVYFGNNVATSTTFWGDKCLSCVTPPAAQPGEVTITISEERPGEQPRMFRTNSTFRYVDDNELQTYKLALRILGQRSNTAGNAYQVAQAIVNAGANSHGAAGGSQGGSMNGGNVNQRQALGIQELMDMDEDMDTRMVKFLDFVDLQANTRSAKLGMKGPTGFTLLHHAVSMGLTRFTAGLIARGADVNSLDHNGNTPMHIAALRGHAHLINRLRLAGADPRSLNYVDHTALDMAKTLEAHQAALLPAHRRSRSDGPYSRPGSSSSLKSFWDTSSGGYDSSDDDEVSVMSMSPIARRRTTSRRSSLYNEPDVIIPSYRSSRRASLAADFEEDTTPEATDATDDSESEPTTPTPATLMVWRNQIAAQIQHFQDNVNRTFPNLPTLPTLPPLPNLTPTMPTMPTLNDYQAHPMVRRISSMVPHRPMSRAGSPTAKEGAAKDGSWWEMLTTRNGPPPPAYDELYPDQEGNDDDVATKKSTLLQAAVETLADAHYEQLSSSAAGTSSTQLPKNASTTRLTSPSSSKLTSSSSSSLPSSPEKKSYSIGRKSISAEQQSQLRLARARKVKKIRSDRKLFFVWIPILLIVGLILMNNVFPGVRKGVLDGVWEGLVTVGRGLAVRPNVGGGVVGQGRAVEV